MRDVARLRGAARSVRLADRQLGQRTPGMAAIDRHERRMVARTGETHRGRERVGDDQPVGWLVPRSEEHTSELQSLMRISYAVFCLKKKKLNYIKHKWSIKYTR